MERPPKRVKLDQKNAGGVKSQKFTSALELRKRLKTQSEASLTETLTSIRNQLSVKIEEPTILPQDDRLLLVQSWLEAAPGLQDVFDIWETTTQRQVTVLLISVTSSVLSLLSSHYTYHALGYPVLKTLLTSSWMRRLGSHLGGAHNELILVALKLLNTMAAFGSGRERNNILEAFPWEIKTLPKLLHMRRKTKTEVYPDTLDRPDIRTSYLLFLLSFVEPGTSSSVKASFLEHHRDAFLSIFKGLGQDSYSVIRKLLEVCWAGIWLDHKIKRTVKIGLFNEFTLQQIMKVYSRSEQEGEEPDRVPADLVHHFLLAICTRPGAGICFKDHGWYPREVSADDAPVDADEERGNRRGGKIYNKILANLLKTLSVNEDSRQQELASKILSVCPELVSGYWSAAALTLEPRLSSKWITNVSFFGSVISLPVPIASFLLPSGTYRPSPPPLSTILENILPSVNTKLHFSKGLQSTSPLVQHCTSLALSRCLIKYEDVRETFNKVIDALEEGDESGQWSRRQRELEREVRRRVPDFQVIVAYAQHKPIEKNATQAESQQSATRTALLSESAQRLLWLYHRCLPLLVAEARFDVGKLLQNFLDDPNSKEEENESEKASKLHIVARLHVLRLLKESDQFAWSGKIATSSRSYLQVLLNEYRTTSTPAIRLSIASLVQHVLSQSLLFQDDPDEVSLWLKSIPTTQRAAGTEAPDGAVLTDEGDSVIFFLDHCIQRCLKTPYRYIEELQDLTQPATQVGHDGDELILGVALSPSPESNPSFLLMTVFEQLRAKLATGALTPSDTLALVSFIRRLIVGLRGKLQDRRVLSTLAKTLDSTLDLDPLFSEYPAMSEAIRKEVQDMHVCLGSTAKSRQFEEDSLLVRDFLEHAQLVPIPSTQVARVKAAYELVDWLRLLDHPLPSVDIGWLVSIVERFHKPALKELFEHLGPQRGVWHGVNIVGRSTDLIHEFSFEYLFLQADAQELADHNCRSVLVETASTHPSLLSFQRAICFICYSLSDRNSVKSKRTVLQLMADIVKMARKRLSLADGFALKSYTFSLSNLTQLCCSSQENSTVHEALVTFVSNCMDSANEDDRRIISDVTAHWANVLRVTVEEHLDIPIAFISPWLPYLDFEGLLDILDFGADRLGLDSSSSALSEAMEVTMSSLHQFLLAPGSKSAVEVALQTHSSQLLKLYSLMPDSLALEKLIAVTVESCLPTYHDSFLLDLEDDKSHSIESLSSIFETRWSRRRESGAENLDILQFLHKDRWSSATTRIVTSLMYTRPLGRNAFFRWLGTAQSSSLSLIDLAKTLRAFFDSSFHSEGSLLDEAETTVLLPHFERLITGAQDSDVSRISRHICASCIASLLPFFGQGRSNLLAVSKKSVESTSASTVTSEMLSIGKRLHFTMPSESKDFVNILIDRGLQWAVRRFSDADDMDEVQDTLIELGHLVKMSSALKPHLVEPVLTAAIKSQLSSKSIMGFLSTILQVIRLKPVNVNRHLQSIVQHPQFFKLCVVSEHNAASPREAIIDVLHILFNLHPLNTCQPSHVAPLIRVYGGTLAFCDRQLLSIFRLFEAQKRVSISTLLQKWSPTLEISSSNPLEALQAIDSTRVLRTWLVFPKWRNLEDHTAKAHSRVEDAQIYDPVFIVLLFAAMLLDSPPSSAASWVELFRTNVVSLLIRALSSKDDRLRDAALSQIAALWKLLDTADMQEKPHVLYILNLLKDVVLEPSEDGPVRLPSYSSLILAHALRGVFYPSNFIYPLTARFLLQRPELDMGDVPMLYGMLYSSSDDWKKERGWIIRFLSDGMMNYDDWKVFKRRHTWDLLASLYQSTKERALRDGILDVLVNITCSAQATTSLVLKSALLTWIEMQLQTSSRQSDAANAWGHILENILIVVDPTKLNAATQGGWCLDLRRCISRLLDDEFSALPVFPVIVRSILRLGLLPGSPVRGVSALLDKAVTCLKRLEKALKIPVFPLKLNVIETTTFPHTAQTLHSSKADATTLQAWGCAVESLWRVAMTIDEKIAAWDALTCRLLMWRAIVGENGSPEGEWARKNVLRNLQNCVL